MAHQESECVQDLPANAKGASECLLTVGKSVKKLFKMQIRLKFSEKIGVYSGNIKTVRSPYFQNDWTPWIKKCSLDSAIFLIRKRLDSNLKKQFFLSRKSAVFGNTLTLDWSFRDVLTLPFLTV